VYILVIPLTEGLWLSVANPYNLRGM
jgi:hypothetical protein